MTDATMDQTTLGEILMQWDEVDSAAQRVLTSQPFQMSENADRLDAERKKMRSFLMSLATRHLRAPVAT